MSKITDFYKGTGTDNSGRTLKDVWSFDDDNLEGVHDYIQWLFPLPEASRFNLDAPLLTAKDIQAFKSDKTLQLKMKLSFHMLLAFYGFEQNPSGGLEQNPGGVAKSANYDEYSKYWLTEKNHNFLRITRILRCLTLVGLEAESKAFLKALEGVYKGNEATITEKTMSYWKAAAKPDSPKSTAPQVKRHQP